MAIKVLTWKGVRDYPEFYGDDLNEETIHQLQHNTHGALYNRARAFLTRACNDIFAGYNLNGKEGIIMIQRTQEPAKNKLWCFGGEFTKGLTLEESVRNKMRNETGLELEKTLICLGHAPVYWKTTPMSSDFVGSQEFAIVFYAKAYGELKLDFTSKNPRLITPEIYKNIKDNLHPYIDYFLGLAIDFATGKIKL